MTDDDLPLALRVRCISGSSAEREIVCKAADEIDRLLAENAMLVNLRALVDELATDLECELEGHYQMTKDHPAITPKYERDMDVVRRARAALERKP